MKQLIIFITFFLFFSHTSFSQGEIDTEKKILFRNERIYGISANSNGYGFGYTMAKRINIHKKFIYEADINLVKHEKEKKSTFYYGESFKRYVYGKTNYAFNIRLGVGMQHVLFKKFDRNSVSVRFFYSGGFTNVFLKPIYYLVYDDVAKNDVWMIFEKNTPYWYIVDRKPFYDAFNEIKLVAGLYAKTGFSFDFGKEDKILNILETGISFEAYPKKIKIMETENNPSFFPSVYIAYRWGKVFSDYYLKEQDEKSEY